MKKILISTAIAFLSLTATQIFAQSPEEMKKWEEFMTPGEMHKWMAKGDGAWNEEVTMWMAPGAPPTTSNATCENKMILGGRFQESKTKGSFNGMPFEGTSLLAYDNVRKVFQSTWIDNMTTCIMTLEGPYDAATKTVTLKGKSTDPMSGTQMEVKQTMQYIDDNNQLIEMYMVQDGKEFKTMSIKLTRKV